MTSPEQTHLDRKFTIPNVISIIRLFFMPVFVILLFPANDRLDAAYLLAILGITDGLDGYIARHFNQESTFGRLIDPIADRVLLAIVLVSAAFDRSVPLAIIAIAAARELCVVINTMVATKHHTRNFGVHWYGKAYTFGLMVAFPLFLASNTGHSLHDAFRVLAYVVAIPSLVAGWISFVIYVKKSRQNGSRSPSQAVAASVSDHGNSF